MRRFGGATICCLETELLGGAAILGGLATVSPNDQVFTLV